MEIKKEIKLKDIENILGLFPFNGQVKINLTYDPIEKMYVIDVFDKDVFLYNDSNNQEKLKTNDILITSIFVTKKGYINNIAYSIQIINSFTKNFCFELVKLIDYTIIDINKEYENLKK